METANARVSRAIVYFIHTWISTARIESYHL